MRDHRLPPVLVAVPLVFALVLPAWGGKAGEVRLEFFRLLNEGVSAYNQGRPAEAVETLSRAASMGLNSFRAHYYLGLALLAERRHEDAVRVLEVALDLDPEHLQCLVSYGDAWLGRGDLGEARAAYFRALKIRPEFPEALDGLARSYDAAGSPDEAIDLFDRAIDSNKGFAPAYVHLGDLYLRMDRLEDAVRLLTEAVTVRPDFAPGLNRLAYAYTRLGLYNDAVATIRRAIELEPEVAEHHARLGQIQVGLGLLSRAEASFERALLLDGTQPDANRGMAEIARRKGDYDTALMFLDVPLGDDRIDARVREDLEAFRARVVAERDRVATLEDALAAGTLEPEGLRELAEILAGRNEWERAAELEARAGSEGAARERLAYYLLRAGRFRYAHDEYRSLPDRGSRADIEVNLGVALAGLGRDEEAAEAYRRALALDPGQPQALLYLGNSLVRTGRRAEAAEQYRRFLTLPNTRGEDRELVRRLLDKIDPEGGAASDDAPPVEGPEA